MSDIMSESARIRRAITTIVREVIDETTKPCFRIYKAKVITAPNGSTCKVQLVGDDNQMDLPYSADVTSVKAGAMVWVATIYDSFSNAVVWLPADFNSALSNYPIGSIYLSVNSTSPASLFGGSWTQIKDCFLLSAGSSYSAGSTGGAATHTLTTNEMPSHRHDIGLNDSTDGPGQRQGDPPAAVTCGFDETTTFSGNGYLCDRPVTEYRSTVLLANTGGGGAHNNMPPYLVVYCWKRVS